MTHWRIVSIDEGEDECWRLTPETDLTSSELVGISVMLAHHCGGPYDESNVYFRAYQKIQEAVAKAQEYA